MAPRTNDFTDRNNKYYLDLSALPEFNPVLQDFEDTITTLTEETEDKGRFLDLLDLLAARARDFLLISDFIHNAPVESTIEFEDARSALHAYMGIAVSFLADWDTLTPYVRLTSIETLEEVVNRL